MVDGLGGTPFGVPQGVPPNEVSTEQVGGLFWRCQQGVRRAQGGVAG